MIIEVTCQEGRLEAVKQALDALSPTGREGVAMKTETSRLPSIAYTVPVKGHAALFEEKARGVDGIISISRRKSA